LISIGDECTLTRGVVILAHDASTKRHLGYTRIGKVKIGRKTFIGAHSVILPGVTIGENVIVGAGSVVTSDIPDNCVAVGNPAKVIKSTVDYIEEHKRTLKKRPVYPDKGWTLVNGITAENRKVMREALDDGIGYVE
jgi:maltose O-acetyltransferase